MKTNELEKLAAGLDNYTGRFYMGLHEYCIMGAANRDFGVGLSSWEFAEFFELDFANNELQIRTLLGMFWSGYRYGVSEYYLDTVRDFCYGATAKQAAMALREFLVNGQDGLAAWTTVKAREEAASMRVLEDA